MSETIPVYWDEVLLLLKTFFPQYFDPDSPSYVTDDMLEALLLISDEARPWCLSTSRANLAQAFFMAYLISVQKETSSGQEQNVKAGPVTSEKEGDVAVTYAMSPGGTTNQSKRPSSDPWDAWNRLWSVCAKGAIVTRFGDPCQSLSMTRTTDSSALSLTLRHSAVALLK